MSGKTWTALCPMPMCQKVSEVIIPTDEYLHLLERTGEPIQDVLTSLSDADRELVLTGICNPCWNFHDEHNATQHLMHDENI